MIFALFCLQSISITFGTVTNVYDIETVINNYLSNTIDHHSLHATSSKYMNMVQDESHTTSRYFQSVRYILHGFVITNETNDSDKRYKKLNFLQSIALFYCDINMSNVVNNTPFVNISIDESKLFMNSSIFPLQLVESYQLVRSEICQRIKLGWYHSVIDLFNPHVRSDSFFSRFIQDVVNFISSNSSEYVYELQRVGQMYPFLAKFGEFELYKQTVIRNILKMDTLLQLQSELTFLDLDNPILQNEIEVCVNQIKYPKMNEYIANILEQQVKSTGNKSFILNHYNCNASDLWHHVRMYENLTGMDAINHQLQVENNTIKMHNLLQLLDHCLVYSARRLTSSKSIIDCTLITFRMYELCDHKINGMDGREYVINAIKCIISNHDVYCSKLSQLTNGTLTQHDDFRSTSLRINNNLKKPLGQAIFYLYLNDLMNDTQFVNIINNNTDSVNSNDIYSPPILDLFNWMLLALEEYKDIEMITKIATVFRPKINVGGNYIFEFQHAFQKLVLQSWMDVLVTRNCTYLTKYFQQRFNRQDMSWMIKFIKPMMKLNLWYIDA